jgi:hypothetical protein
MLWKSYQSSKSNNITSTPAHVILSPNDNSNLLNFMNFDNIGLSTVKDSTAFKKIQYFSKINPTRLFNIKSDFENNFVRINNFFKNDIELASSSNYGMSRQHNYLLSSPSTLLDSKSSKKFFDYNLSANSNSNDLSRNLHSINRFNSSYSDFLSEDLVSISLKLFPKYMNSPNMLNFYYFFNYAGLPSLSGSESDSKQFSNNFKYLLSARSKKKLLWDFQ